MLPDSLAVWNQLCGPLISEVNIWEFLLIISDVTAIRKRHPQCRRWPAGGVRALQVLSLSMSVCVRACPLTSPRCWNSTFTGEVNRKDGRWFHTQWHHVWMSWFQPQTFLTFLKGVKWLGHFQFRSLYCSSRSGWFWLIFTEPVKGRMK